VEASSQAAAELYPEVLSDEPTAVLPSSIDKTRLLEFIAGSRGDAVFNRSLPRFCPLGRLVGQIRQMLVANYTCFRRLSRCEALLVIFMMSADGRE
jgi:hypothetical protein